MTSIRSTFFKLLNSAKYTNYFTAETQLKLLEEYRNSIGLSNNLDFGIKEFDNYISNKFKDHTSFKTLIPTIDNKEITLEEALENHPDDVAVEAFKKLTPNGNLLTAAEKYKEEMKLFHEVIKNETHPVETYRNRLEKIYNNAILAIEEQHQHDLKNLEAALNNNFLDKIKCKAPSVLKTKLTAELEQAKQNNLNHLKKSTQEYLTKLDKASNLEREHTIYTAHLINSLTELSTKKRQEMQKEIERTRNINLKRLGRHPDQATVEWDIKNRSIQTIDPRELNFIISMTGQKIHHDKDSNTWSIDFPARIWSPFYYANPKSKVRVEALTIASAIKASGFEKITMNLNFANEKIALQRAKEAYRACLEVGFEPDKIMIQVNGRDMKAEEIFRDKPTVLQQLQQQAAMDREKLSNAKSPKGSSYSDARNEMDILRKEQLASNQSGQNKPIATP